MSADHERIWLQAPADANETEGRMWCQDKVWPEDPEDSEPTEYVRADLFEALRSRLEARVATLSAALEPFSDMAGEMFARGWDASNVALALDNPGDSHRVTAGDFFAARTAREASR